MIKLLVFLRYFIIFVAVFMGFYYLEINKEITMKIVVGGMVGCVGLLSFVTHVIFHKADAKRLGWQTDRPDWQFEVGFANLAFGISALLSLTSYLPARSGIVITIAYALYLFQAAILHGIRALQSTPIKLKKLILSSGLTFVFVFFMIYFTCLTY